MDGSFGYDASSPPNLFGDRSDPLHDPNMYPVAHYMQTDAVFAPDSVQLSSELDDSALLASPDKAPRPKRKQHGPDHVKHKRTRSGCYTCRQRRIKCDEIRPQCDRCRKGKRDCSYPDPAQTKTSRRDSTKSHSPSAASESDFSEEDGDDHGDRRQTLETIVDDDENSQDAQVRPASSANDRAAKSQKTKSPPTLTKAASTNSDTTAKKRSVSAPRRSSKQTPNSAALPGARTLKLPKDILFFLRYSRENITCNHYCLKHDASNFLKTTFLEIAYKYEPLLYAITAFSAYFHTLHRPDGKIHMFLQYYNKSVTLLRRSLGSATKHTAATLLTILQLATFEEFLGDWVNVMAHQKAAYEILTQLFTVDNVMQNETRRKILCWYMRFDIMTGLVSGAETRLDRSWHAAYTDYYIMQAAARPDDLDCIIDEKFAKSGLLADDFAHLFGKKASSAISDKDFAAEIDSLTRRVDEHDRDLLRAFQDTRTYVKDFPNAPLDRSGDIPNVDATAPDYLWADPLYAWNLLLIDWFGMKLMYLGQLYQFDQDGSSGINPTTIAEMSYRICRLFEGLLFAKKGYTSDILAAHSNFGLAVTALPKDERHNMWCRRHLALVERCGYIYPPSLRARLSLLWGGADVEKWWLPNDEGLLPVIRQVRDFIADRATTTPLPAADEQTGSVRDLRALFSAMELKEGDDPRRAMRQGSDESGLPTAASSEFGLDAMEFDDSWLDGVDGMTGSGPMDLGLGGPPFGAGGPLEDIDWDAMDFGSLQGGESPFATGTGTGTSARSASQGME